MLRQNVRGGELFAGSSKSGVTASYGAPTTDDEVEASSSGSENLVQRRLQHVTLY